MSPYARDQVFRLASAATFLAAGYHLAALVVPAFARIAYPATYPAWRHVLFVIIDAGSAWLLLVRPPWLIWPYSVLVVQVWAGHGVEAWQHWRERGAIDGISIISVIGVSIILALLIVDRRRARPSSYSDRRA